MRHAALLSLLFALPLWALAAPAGAASPRVAVLELQHRAGLDPPEADYLTDLVRGVAGSRGDLFVLTRENIVELLPPGTELAACEGDCEVETGRKLGVDFVVSGEIVAFGGELRILLRLHATRTGALLGSERAGAPEIKGLEAPLEAAATTLLARIGGGEARAVGRDLPRAPPLAPGRVEPRSGPRVPVELFLQREPFAADPVAAARLGVELAALIERSPPGAADRAALLERRGLLGWRSAVAERIRAFEAEETCLHAAADAAERVACATARAARIRDTERAATVAIETLTEAVAAPGAGSVPEALLALADSQRMAGDRKAARATIDQLATRAPDRVADGRLLLGVMFFDEGRYDFAERALRTLLEDHPGSTAAPYAHYLLGWSAIRRGRHKAAIGWLKRVLAGTRDARPDHPADRAAAYLRREARIDLVMAWSDQPKRRLDGAFRLFAEIDPTDGLGLPEVLAEMYAARGRRADARAVLDRLTGALTPRCQGGDARGCATLERLCARHGGAACPAR